MPEQTENYHVDLVLSRIVSAGSLPKSCYRNAIMAAAHPALDISFDALWYVEGYLVVSGQLLCDHGWLEVGHYGIDEVVTIIDPSIPMTTSDVEIAKIPYYAGARWTYREALDLAGEGTLPFCDWNHREICTSGPYLQCMKDAFDFAGIKLPEGFMQLYHEKTSLP